MTPTTRPHHGPHINPQRRTGICIRSNILPSCWFCPVKRGSIMPIAKNTEDKTIFCTDFFFILKPPIYKKPQRTDSLPESTIPSWYHCIIKYLIYRRMSTNVSELLQNILNHPVCRQIIDTDYNIVTQVNRN